MLYGKTYYAKRSSRNLGISIATLDAARNNGLISYVQYVQNGCVYFTSAGLQEYIAKCTTEQSQQKRTQLIVNLAELECEPVRILVEIIMV